MADRKNQYTICILANNPLYLDCMLRNFPDIDQARFIVVNETRYRSCLLDLRDVLSKYKCNYELLSSKQVCKFVYECLKKEKLELTSEGLKFFKEYRMGMKVLLPYYIMCNYKCKVFFCDDDCIFLSGWQNLFNFDHPVWHKSTFVNNYKEGSEYTNYFLWLSKHDAEYWTKNYIANGHYLLRTGWISRTKLLQMIKSFFNSAIVQHYWQRYIDGKEIGRGWFLDMEFTNAFAKALLPKIDFSLSKMHLCELGQWVNKPERKCNIKKFDKRAVLVHYCMRDKEKYINMAISNGYIV